MNNKSSLRLDYSEKELQENNYADTPDLEAEEFISRNSVESENISTAKGMKGRMHAEKSPKRSKMNRKIK